VAGEEIASMVASTSSIGGEDWPSPQRGRLAHRHLVEGDGGGEALGVQVPARLAAQRQERVEVGVRAGRDVVGRRAAQREVEQHQRQLAAAVARRCRCCRA
jgi:hypothetical protein